MLDENDFSLNTKRTLALRAGYLCSMCGKLTVGPSQESEESINLIGEAAHIYSARPRAKRYNKDMKPQERRNIKNGIWLCRNHHKNIDSDECQYSAAFLKNIRQNHEKRVDLLSKGIKLDIGIITKLTLKNLGLFVTSTIIEFGNSTLIFGRNGTGKTLITDFISSLDDTSKIYKWKGRRNKGSSNVKLEYYDSTIKEYEINYSARNEIAYSFNDSIVPVILSPYYCLSFENDFFRKYYNPKSITKSLANYFKIEENELIDLINYLNKHNKEFINEIYIDNNELLVMIDIGSPELIFQALSTGEQYRVIVEIGLRLANYYSKYKPVIVVLEHTALGSLDIAGINSILKSINSRKNNYQFIFTSYMDMTDFEFENHTVYQLNFDDISEKIVNATLVNQI